MYVLVSIHTYCSQLCQLRESRSSDNLVIMSTHVSQILVSNTILQLKKPELLLEKLAVSKIWEGNIQDEPQMSCSDLKEW